MPNEQETKEVIDYLNQCGEYHQALLNQFMRDVHKEMWAAGEPAPTDLWVLLDEEWGTESRICEAITGDKAPTVEAGQPISEELAKTVSAYITNGGQLSWVDPDGRWANYKMAIIREQILERLRSGKHDDFEDWTRMLLNNVQGQPPVLTFDDMMTVIKELEEMTP